jgi:hypothetical protein
MGEVRKVVINARCGGFGLSVAAVQEYARRKGVDPGAVSEYEIPRDDADLVAVVEEMGKGADGRYADLKVVEIPADVQWQIQEYDGLEWVAEEHRTWGTSWGTP